MKPSSHLILLTAAAAAYALPIDAAAAGLLLFVAGVAAIIRIDYADRYRGLPLPRATAPSRRPRARATFHAPPLQTERNQLAA
jgi:hypothetical protein